MDLELITSYFHAFDVSLIREGQKLICITGSRPPKDKTLMKDYDSFIARARNMMWVLLRMNYMIISGGAEGIDMACLTEYRELGGLYLCLTPVPLKRTDELDQSRVAHVF